MIVRSSSNLSQEKLSKTVGDLTKTSIPCCSSYCTSGDLKVIHGQGMPSQRHHEPGDMYVKLDVKFPESINVDAIPLLERALPPRKPIQTFDKNILLEEVHLDDVDTRSRGGIRDDAMDEDAQPGEPRV